MSHEIEMVEGQAQMAYAGELPWHGLGVEVGDDLTPKEMMVTAGLDWTVEKEDVFYSRSGSMVRAPKRQALVRSSDDKYLDIVSDNWIPVQNEEAFEFFDDYVKAGGMSMHTAGSLKDGQIIWGLAKVNDSFSLFGGKDEVESYLLLSNPHNYGKGVDVRFTPIRVVCNNTLSMSLNGKASLGISLNHRSQFDSAKVKLALDEASQKMSTYHDMAQFLSEKRYTQDSLFEFFSRVFPKTTNRKGATSFDELMKQFKKGEKVVSRNAVAAMEIVETQPGAELGAGSWWSAYNAVTYMTNHQMGHNPDTRMQSVWYGTNKDRNIDALGLAVEYAESA
jgi:phage/plasmid-like protein (TIGR03299 family)|tara:strand:+ start:209 stop:1213 length:1005 start_codon:yes stop_codon:yes gene_type:complete